MCNGYKKDIFGFLITGFELSYPITAEPCMESVTCYGMESMQSIVWNQAAGKYTFGDAIRLRQFHTRWRVMPYQACGLNATKNKKAVHWTAFVFVLYRLNRCHHGKVNKIKVFLVLRMVLYASLIDANFNFNKI